jgi:hypothetical protein
VVSILPFLPGKNLLQVCRITITEEVTEAEAAHTEEEVATEEDRTDTVVASLAADMTEVSEAVMEATALLEAVATVEAVTG